jgi:hypothetical protein
LEKHLLIIAILSLAVFFGCLPVSLPVIPDGRILNSSSLEIRSTYDSFDAEGSYSSGGLKYGETISLATVSES